MSNDAVVNNNKDIIKIILIGNSETGKTNLINVSAGYGFDSQTLTTRACSYIQKTVNIHNSNYNVNLWDTIGQERFRSLTKIFIKDSKIVILVYDITSKKSFESLPFWKGIVDEQIKTPPIFGIVGNKMDLFENEEVDKSELIDYADKIGAKYLLTSAKLDSVSISKFIDTLIDDYLKSKNKNERIPSFSLDKRKSKKKNKCCK